MKKYFISYQWRDRDASDSDHWRGGHDIIDEHPLTWLYRCNGADYKDEHYHLLFWKELTEDEIKLIREDEDLPLT